MIGRALCLAWITLRCTLPSYMAVPEDSAHHCMTSEVREGWISAVRLYGQYQGGPGQLLQTYPGQPAGTLWQGAALIDTSQALLLWLTTADSVGNEDRCGSNRMLRRPDLVTGVPHPVWTKPETAWFDVAGRRLREHPRRRGVYFFQVPGRLGRRWVVK